MCLGAYVMFITKTIKGRNLQILVGGVFSWDIRMVQRVEDGVLKYRPHGCEVL